MHQLAFLGFLQTEMTDSPTLISSYTWSLKKVPLLDGAHLPIRPLPPYRPQARTYIHTYMFYLFGVLYNK